MKKIVLIIMLLGCVIASWGQEGKRVEFNDYLIKVNHRNGYYTFYPYGNVYVETDPLEPADLYVYHSKDIICVNYFVCTVTDTPQKTGEWRFVGTREQADFSIKFIEEEEYGFHDINIYFVKDRSKAGYYGYCPSF